MSLGVLAEVLLGSDLLSQALPLHTLVVCLSACHAVPGRPKYVLSYPGKSSPALFLDSIHNVLIRHHISFGGP